MSPDAHYTVYYQPFTLTDCQGQAQAGQCLHLGVWLATSGDAAEEPELIYSVDLSEADQTGGLNFIPTWSPQGNSFVFFQEGRLIHYDIERKEAMIWYKPVSGKLRSVPIFSPNEEAVAFVDNQGQGFSEYRLVIVNPKLQPVEHIIDTQQSFLVLAWLPS
jgi:Tol biopolymer transport system component